MIRDPYVISQDTIKEPPGSRLQQFKFLGPGFILSASIVGSGELIATTSLGAKAGFVSLWVIIVSCLAKVAVQLEFGKHAVLTGETVMQAFGKLPGPKWRGTRWTVWTVFVFMLLKIIQLGGMLGGTVVILNLLFPAIPIPVWTGLVTVGVSSLIYKGKYQVVEKFSLFMIGMFTILTLASLFSLQFTSFRFSLIEVISQQQFGLSAETLGYAIGAFGITGVASDEIIAYNYWCLEKGYAAYTGPADGTEAWRKRAEGWINVMFLDAIVAMIIYTLVTVAFYLLGAAILHQHRELPTGNQIIETLALIYTQTLGPGVRNIYLIGGFFALFSSLFASLAAWTRVYSDVSGQMGWIDFKDMEQRRRVISILAWIFPLLWALAYYFIQLPVLMVLSGGVVGSFMLFIVIFAAWNYKYRSTKWPSGILYDIAFWISIASIFFVGVLGLKTVFF